jgi:hypothetical protein
MKIYRSKRAFWARYKTPENYWHTAMIGAEKIVFFISGKKFYRLDDFKDDSVFESLN